MKKSSNQALIKATACLFLAGSAMTPLYAAEGTTESLNARTTRVQLSCPEGVSLKGYRIVIDPNNEIDEIYESNNQVVL